MRESRCGANRSACYYREENDCKGCLNMTLGYWDESCEIKECCGLKKHEHCGQCKTFPCEILLDISYDEDLGDDGDRLMRLKYWQETDEQANSPLYKKLIIGILAGLSVGVILGEISVVPMAWVILGILVGAAIPIAIYYFKKL